MYREYYQLRIEVYDIIIEKIDNIINDNHYNVKTSKKELQKKG